MFRRLRKKSKSMPMLFSLLPMLGEFPRKFNLNSFLKSDMLVDEFQDCTQADFKISFNLVKDVNNLTFAGDLAQAIHIGKSADTTWDENMRRKERLLLEGSYRLPQRISESIKKLSETIVLRWKNNEGGEEIAPVKILL